MSKRTNKSQNGNWQDRIHEVNFTPEQVAVLKTLVEADNRSAADLILDLCVDNNSFKVKSAEFYDSYTFSYTLDKHHPKWGGHTFWFWHDDLPEGIAIMAAYVSDFLTDDLSQGGPKGKKAAW